jgi:hypothetical protein
MPESAGNAVSEQQDLAVVQGEANARLFLLSLAIVVPVSVVLMLMGVNDPSHGFSLLVTPLLGLVVPLMLSRRSRPRPTQVGLITTAVVLISIATEWTTIGVIVLLRGA